MVQKCLPIEINGICLKPLTKYLKSISKKWMIFIIMIFPIEHNEFSGKIERLRYSEIKTRIKGLTSEKISDTTLSARLKELEAIKILKKEHFAEIPPRVEYYLTPLGIQLRNSLLPLIEWAVHACHET
ncbi:MAG: helix-turn-helix transcriptional regulator [Candidatus Heimdallarchaeota archaeon]|nr:MAG: helix-turn-helix transcriptional regulator [Candidatus Heimdallarchaeota archaeon]